MVEKLDAMVKPWWLMPRVFIGLMVAMLVASAGYIGAQWLIKQYVFDWIARLLW